MHGLDEKPVAEFDAPPQLPAAALAWADLTSSPGGQPWDPERRVAEPLDRYTPGSPVHEATQASLPALRESVRDIEDLLHHRR